MTLNPPGRPLEGILVVSLEQAVAAPYCASRLADAGARVIKLERPEGDFARGYDHVVHGESAYFVWLNRGKESAVVDIKNPDDLAFVRRMIARADVFIQNLAPGAAARAGLGSDDLRREFPRLVTCDISGYGEDGPYREMKAYDLLVQAETGLCSVTGVPEGPGRVGVSVCDIACGMYAYIGILEALVERQRTGCGKGIAVSLFDSMADWMAGPLLHVADGGKAPEREGLRHPSIAPYGAYMTADGVQIIISIQNEREWASFAGRIMGHPEWAREGPFRLNVERVKNRPALEREVAAVFAAATGAEMQDRLREARIAYGVVNPVAELSRHPVLRRVAVATPSGPAAIPAPPVRAKGGATATLGAVPGLGEHTERLRKEFAA